MDAEPKPVELVIDIPILESIKSAQMSHGLKYENYQRYMTYCSRRLYRLRKSINVHQGVAATAKARHQKAKKFMEINNTMVLEAGEKDPEYGTRMVLVQLFLTERSWSHYMLLKQEATELPRKRFHMMKRLKKAAKHAEKFVTLCHDPESPCTQRTKEEATAYGAYVKGLYCMERQEWSEAKALFDESLKIYFKISVPILDDEILVHYRQKIDELRANLKYCLFNLGEVAKVRTKMQFFDIAARHVMDELLENEQKEIQQQMEVEQPKVAPSVDGTGESEDEDEFENAPEDHVIKSVDDDDSEESDDDDNDEVDEQPKAGGVTGLVKNWLGGAWSSK